MITIHADNNGGIEIPSNVYFYPSQSKLHIRQLGQLKEGEELVIEFKIGNIMSRTRCIRSNGRIIYIPVYEPPKNLGNFF